VQKWRFPRSISGQFERSDFFNTIDPKQTLSLTVVFGLKQNRAGSRAWPSYSQQRHELHWRDRSPTTPPGSRTAPSWSMPVARRPVRQASGRLGVANVVRSMSSGKTFLCAARSGSTTSAHAKVAIKAGRVSFTDAYCPSCSIRASVSPARWTATANGIAPERPRCRAKASRRLTCSMPGAWRS